MRLSLTLVLALFSIWQQSQPPAPTRNKVLEEKQDQAKDKNSKASSESNPPEASLGIGSQTIAQTGPDGGDKREEKFPTDRWLTGFTGALVAVAVLQFVAMHRQADYMRRGLRISIQAARAARNAATAASENAVALKNAERPWLIPKITREVKQAANLRAADEGQTYRNVTYFTFSVTNVGRTPAKILAIRGDPRISYEGIDGGFTDPPDYGLPIAYRQVRMLVPNETWEPRVDINIWPFDSTPNIAEEIKSRKAHYIYKGIVLYSDSFDLETIHETRFCYTYSESIDDWRMSGPPDHTRYT